MPADPRMLEMLSYYRDAELHGSRQAFPAPRAASIASSAANPERRPA